ncbi:PQQ-dependent sugar dehydrogenase [Tianweitania sediminis]|jgi:glucose/arabinose dehydrogenase|uniref:Sorbosone dehydrogenase family protein n=1 Tax=Tianweitania sediminis TaxID=1502156 RepID=A0A8J7R495_9HYPH|nr:sorbosone dehydrogenase family protein [Tianweitania sediminis]MBP0437112.1 sorbosone dehydrogenase family protein [Tianweitania sediminis]HEV7416933.1 sorbosone dehydrogenase family protein [Tianweitania sediminis]
MTRLLAFGLATLLASTGLSHAQALRTGPNPDLPPLTETLVPRMKIADPTGWNGELPTVPAGYAITALATDFQIPRQMLLLPNGDILVAEGRGGYAPKLRPKDVIAGYIKSLGTSSVKGGNRITLLRDADNDGVAELRTEFITGLNAPYGMALVGNEIFVANQDALLRFPYQEGQTQITEPGEEVTKLPRRINHHWTKSLAASADGSKLYVGVGSNSNVGERGMDVEEDRAVVWEIDRASGAHRVFATGIRNPTALAIEPGTGALWAVVNERDELGPDLVPDYLTSVQDGAFYGWPYSYWGQNVDPRVKPERPDLVEQAIAPDYALGSHVAALGLSFATNGGMGGEYSEGAFVGEHGSWNRPNLAGYKVAFVPFSGGRPNGEPRDFVTGFLEGENTVRGRPVGVLFDERTRSVLIADDLSNTVWKVTRVGPVSAAVQ